ncbi:AraC family transcriptional regulator [Parapedobacter sp. 10938]|uniref:AraC family transcriptional regulator n=1 Tax=Parapedobacter flavus TaxID=3110225 RepID=UPI002DBA5120|nr:AraC family transcriptional regulator [Parapedobacter sp. 10938]MEC3880596.1 AraC family transcriptional regulator [Parapedobacter sp. 10938]
MKPLFHKVPTQIQASFSARHDVQPNFGSLWHYHPELELHHVIRGKGVRLIGDNIGNFSAGEVLLLGGNLPHMWQSNEEYYQNHPTRKVEAIVIQFLPDCMGRDFTNLPEMYLLPKLFENARKGMKFTGRTRARIVELMYKVTQATEMERLIMLLSILKTMAETDEYQSIASAHAFYKSNEMDAVRINKVCTYTLSNYKKEINLEEIAAIANLSVTSFCRYFKLMTKKTFYDFLIEIRISHACRLLVEDILPTEVICFECGFNNVSNFYRHFKKITDMTPLEYKKKYLYSKVAVGF